MRTRRAAALLALLSVGFLAAGLFPQEPLRRLVEGRLRKAVGPGTRLGRLHVVPALLRADLVDLRLEAPGLELDVPRARLALSPSILWSRSLSLDLVELHEPRLRLEPVPGPPGASPAALPALIARRVVVDGGEIRYRDPALGGALRLGGLAVRGGIGEGTLTLEATEGAWEGPKALALGPTRARLVLNPRLDVRLETLELGTPASRLHVSGDVVRAGRFHPDLRFEGRLDLADASPWAGSPLMGALRAEGRLTEAAGTTRLEGTLSGRDLRLAGWTVDAAEARLEQQDGISTLALRLDLAGGRAEADGRLDPRQGSARLRVARLDLARLGGGALGQGTLSAELRGQGGRAGPVQVSGWLEAEGLPAPAVAATLHADVHGAVVLARAEADLAWTAAAEARAPSRGLLEAQIEAQGTARGPFPPRVAGEINGRLLFGGGESPAATALTGSLHEQGDRWGLALEMNGLGGRASLAAEAHADQLEKLSGRIEDASMAPLVPAARGRLSLNLEASGPLASPSFTGRGRVEDLAWREAPLGSLAFGAEGRPGRIDFSLEAPALHASARGHLDAGRSPALQASLALSSSPLAPFFQAAGFPPAAGLPLTGEATAAVEVTLPLARPGALSLQARVDGLTLQRGDLTARAGPFTARLSEGLLDVEDLALEGPGLRLQASGRLGLDEDAPLDVRSQVALDLAALPLPEGWKRSGTLSTDLRLGGRRNRPQASGAVRLQDVTVEGPRLPPMTVPAGEIRLEGQAASTSGITAQWAGGTVTLSGRMPLAALLPSLRAAPPRSEDQADVRLAWEGLHAPTLGASLSGEAELQGGLASLAESRASLSVPATALRIEDQDLQLQPFALRLEKGRLSSEGITVASAGASFRLAGSLDLGRRALDLSGKGLLDLRTLSPFLAQAALTGSADVDVAVGGTLETPLPRGEVHLRGGTLRLRDLREPVTALQATLRFDGREARLEDASAALGGGTLTMTGTTTLPGFATKVQVEGRDVGLRYPPGLRSRMDADLTLTGRPGDFRLAGRVQAERGLYDLDIALEQSLLAPVVKPTSSPLLRSIALDVSVETRNPVLVRNNLAQLEATGQLTARGDLETPAPFGRLEIRPGGKVFLQGREFRVTRGGLSYTGSWDPEIGIVAEARIRPADEPLNYDVTVSVEGTLESPQVSLSSDPPPPSEGALLSLIATGRLGGEMLQSGQWIVGGQAAALLAGRLTRGVAQTLGLSEVSIRPDLLAREADPGARFTFGKALTPRVGLIYSVGLGGPEARFFQLEGRPGRDVTLTLQRRDDGVFTYGAGQAFHWGGAALPSESRKDEDVDLEAVRLEGELGLPETALREALRARPGRSVSPWDVQEDADRLGDRLRREDYLEAQVGARLEGRTAVFTVHSGPRYSWRVEGLADAPDLDDAVRGALYEEEALDKGRERLIRELRRRGYLRGAVTARAVDEASERRLVFTVTPGPRLRLAGVSFPGASALSASRLLDAAGGASSFLTAPAKAVLGIHDAYRERYHLAAQVDPPRVRESGGEVRIEVPVHEGPPARLASVRFEGATLPEDELRKVTALEPGGSYDPAAAAAAATRLRDHYLGRGYPAVRVRPEAVATGDDLELVLNVTEGPHLVVGSVEIVGNRRTREGLVRSLVRIRPGDPLDPRELAAAERSLLDLGVFSSVIVTPTSENPATVRVELREGPVFTAGYDLRYNDEERGTVLVEGEARNLLGRALKLGGRYRVGADVREARGTLSVPGLRKGALTASVFNLEEDFGGESQITQRQRGFQLQQTVRLPGRWDLLAGYRFRRNTTIAADLPSLPIDVAGLDLSLLREARDSILDARHGSFLSLNLELAPAALRSEAPFAKGFAQASLARPLGSAFTWAQGYQLGLSWGFEGQPVIPFERFHAGGANSLRGFGTGEVGPRDFLGDPGGGEAVVVVNQELRYHHPSGLGAAAFYDVGNVFPTVREMSFDLRHTLGAGLRWASPVGLLRLDVGFPLSREPGEKAYHVFFSLGQAF